MLDSMSEITVAALYYYPIKSCQGVSVPEADISPLGIQYDRQWMIVDQKNRFLSQRTHPALARVATAIEGGALAVSAPGMSDLHIPLEQRAGLPEESVTIWNKPGTATSEGEEAAAYFRTYLGLPQARLLRIAQPRGIKPKYIVKGAATSTGFADGFPILLTSTSSLEAFNAHMPLGPVGMDRFRPNIVVEGGLLPYMEDYWRKIRIGAMGATIVKASNRCPVPNVDQQEGILPPPAERHVSQTLRSTRSGHDAVTNDKGVFFGQNIVHTYRPGLKVRVGDSVVVKRLSAHPNVQLSAT